MTYDKYQSVCRLFMCVSVCVSMDGKLCVKSSLNHYISFIITSSSSSSSYRCCMSLLLSTKRRLLVIFMQNLFFTPPHYVSHIVIILAQTHNFTYMIHVKKMRFQLKMYKLMLCVYLTH